MAKDIKIKFVADTDNGMPVGDFVIGKGDLETDKGLESSVLISLFTDKRAAADDPYDNSDRRGWWGDLINQVNGDEIGSKLYLLDRSKATDENAIKAQQYAYDALEWMIEDGIVRDIEIESWTFGNSENKRLGLLIKIYKKLGGIEEFKFDDLWQYTSTIGG